MPKTISTVEAAALDGIRSGATRAAHIVAAMELPFDPAKDEKSDVLVYGSVEYKRDILGDKDHTESGVSSALSGASKGKNFGFKTWHVIEDGDKKKIGLCIQKIRLKPVVEFTPDDDGDASTG